MKPRTHTLQCLLAAMLPLAAAGPLPLLAAPPAQQAKTKAPQSNFVIPSNPSEGRDPFFPDSKRVYAGNPEGQKRGPSLADLTLRSILGTPPRVFAIINNHTFAAGDDEDVLTKSGQRLHVLCVGINPQAGTATVEANGTSIALHLSEKP
jgi:hypothetical protein